MKRIILGLSLLLMLVQNGFARSDAEWDRLIANEPDMYWKQSYKCNKAMHHPSTSDVNDCLKSIELIKKNPNGGLSLSIVYLNTGVIYNYHNDKLKAYEYYMKAAKLGGKAGVQAQKNLNNMCKESPWACK